MPRTDITRFPHAVLEVKLSLRQGEEAPEWIKVGPAAVFTLSAALRMFRRLLCCASTQQDTDLLPARLCLVPSAVYPMAKMVRRITGVMPAQELLSSGYLTEVHKFSKFIHGTATLMPDMVQVRIRVCDEYPAGLPLFSAMR